jgi:hypothetical protein
MKVKIIPVSEDYRKQWDKMYWHSEISKEVVARNTLKRERYARKEQEAASVGGDDSIR